MKCDKFSSELTLKGSRAIEPDAKQHISKCKRCRAQFDRCQAMETALRYNSAKSANSMPEELRSSIMEEISKLNHSQRMHRISNPFIKVAIGCAAALFLIVAAVTLYTSEDKPPAIADATPHTEINLFIAENMRGGQAIFNASELAMRGLSEEFELLKQDFAKLTQKYDRFIETRLFMASSE